MKDTEFLKTDCYNAHEEYGITSKEWIPLTHEADVVVIDGVVYKDRYNGSTGEQSEIMPKKFIVCARTEKGAKRIYRNF